VPLFMPFTLVGESNDTPLPTNPIVLMQLAEYVPEQNQVFIGAHLMTDRDVDDLVDHVVREAESFRRLAKHELDLARTRASRR
jgi:hypothetical protein